MIWVEKEKPYVPIWEKSNLTIEEATAYFNIGRDKLREMMEDKSVNFVLEIGKKHLIKRKQFEQYLEKRRNIWNYTLFVRSFNTCYNNYCNSIKAPFVL